MKTNRLSVATEILQEAQNSERTLKEIIESKGLPHRFLRDFIFDLNAGRVNVPKHVKGRLLHLYETIRSRTSTPTDGNKALAIKLLKKSRVTSVEEFADLMDLSPSKAKQVIKDLQSEGYTLTEENNRVTVSAPRITSYNLEAVERFGALGDTHLCSKYERLDLLNRTYDRFQELGITTVFHTGNWIDGEARFNFSDIHTHGLDNQIEYFLEHYPKREGITTYYIGGDK